MAQTAGMSRTIALYGALLAAGALALQWLEYQFFARAFALEVYLTLIALASTALGVWLGARLAGRPRNAASPRNDAAIAALGLTPREVETLELIAAGLANKEIARTLGVSPNTVKSHAASVYRKLSAGRRTEAVARARELAIIA